MGRQVNFWMMPADERDFIERIDKDDAVWTYYALPLGGVPQMFEFEAWYSVEEGQRLIIIRRNDWRLLEVEHISESPNLPNVSFTPWTRVGTGASPSFEWDCCVRQDRRIQRGRIYFRTDWLEDGVLRNKSEEPTRWFDRLSSWIKRKGRRYKSTQHILLPGAASLVDEGAAEIVDLL